MERIESKEIKNWSSEETKIEEKKIEEKERREGGYDKEDGIKDRRKEKPCHEEYNRPRRQCTNVGRLNVYIIVNIYRGR